MGIFSGLFKSRDKPQNRTAGSNYAFFMGGTTSGKTVTERSAMQMTAVYSCVRILSEAVAGLPLHLYKYTDSGGKTMALDHPLYHLLHDEPNPEMSSFVFRETLMTHLLLWGNAYAQIIRNGKNEIVALYPLMPNKMSVDRDETGRLYYTYYRGSDEAIKDKGSSVTLHPSEVLHIPGLGFDGLVGYSPIAMAKNAIGMAIACEEYGAKFFANGAAPGGVLEHPGTIKDPQRVRESWQSTFGGSGNANKIAVLEEGMKYTPIGISPEQAQFLETRKFQINEIARIFQEMGIAVIHDKTLHDSPSYNDAYDNARTGIEGYLEQYPTIQMVLDIHRDALVDSDGTVYKPVLQIDGVKTAQVMLLVGTDDAGATFPDWTEHLALAMEIQQEMNSLWPGLARPITLRTARFNQQLTKGSLLVEVGSHGNTLEEALAGARLFARSAAKVLLARVGA